MESSSLKAAAVIYTLKQLNQKGEVAVVHEVSAFDDVDAIRLAIKYAAEWSDYELWRVDKIIVRRDKAGGGPKSPIKLHATRSSNR